MIVGLECDKNILDCGKECDGPDHQGQGSQDQVVIDGVQAAVAGNDRLHNIHRRGADITVDDAKGYNGSAQANRNFCRFF